MIIDFNIHFESNIGSHLFLIACYNQNYTFKMFSKEWQLEKACEWIWRLRTSAVDLDLKYVYNPHV